MLTEKIYSLFVVQNRIGWQAYRLRLVLGLVVCVDLERRRRRRRREHQRSGFGICHSHYQSMIVVDRRWIGQQANGFKLVFSPVRERQRWGRGRRVVRIWEWRRWRSQRYEFSSSSVFWSFHTD